MAGSQTNGFDAVLELSEARVLGIIRTLFTVPGEISIPLEFGGEMITITATPDAGNFPSSVTILSGNRLDVEGRFTSLRIQRGSGRVTVRNVTLRVRAVLGVSGGNISLSFPSAATITSSDPTFLPLIDLVVAAINMAAGSTLYTRDSLLSEAGTRVRDWLASQVTTLPSIPLGVNFSTMACPISVRNFAIHTIDHFAFVLVAVSGAGIPTRTLNPAGFTRSNLGTNDAGLMFANVALLSAATCFLTQEPMSPFRGQTFTASGDCRNWSGNLTLGTFEGVTVRARSLSICIVGNEIIISGSVDLNTTGVFGSASFTAPVGFRTDGAGRVFPVLDPNRIATNVSIGFEAWVWVAAIFAAGIFLALAGPIAGAIVLGLLPFLTVIANIVANSVVRALLPQLTGAIDPLVMSGYSMLPAQVQQIIGTVGVQQVILDDLLVAGTGNALWRPEVILRRTTHRRIESVTRGITPDGSVLEFLGATEQHTRYSDTYQLDTRDVTGITGYNWYINGRLVAGSGTQRVIGGTLSYHAAGSTIMLTNALGESPVFTLTGRVRTSSGFARSRSLTVQLVGREAGRNRFIPGLELVEQQFRIPEYWLPDPPPIVPEEWAVARHFEAAVVKGMKIKPEELGRLRFKPQPIPQDFVQDVFPGDLLVKGADAIIKTKSGKGKTRSRRK